MPRHGSERRSDHDRHDFRVNDGIESDPLTTFTRTAVVRPYPKIEPRQGRKSCRYAASMCLGGTGFLEFSHQVSIEMYVDTRE